MDNVEQFSNILMMILIVLVIVLFALTIVYISIRTKENQALNQTNKKDKKKGKTQDYTNDANTVQSINKQNILNFMEFDKIEDNMIVQKGGKRFVMVVECQGINYDLMSDMEKTSVEEGFIQFLNTLRHPIQLYVQTRTVNLADSIQRYNSSVDQVEMELNKLQLQYNQMKQSSEYTQEDLNRAFFELTKKRNLYEYGKDIIKNTEAMSLNKNVLTKKYYIVISYYSEDAGKEEYSLDEIQNMSFSELYTKAQSIIRTLYACSVSGKILNSYELVELLYNAYNREQAEVFGLNKAIQAGYQELYSVAPDVIDKRERILDKQIQAEAMKLAQEETSKARTKKQMNYEERRKNMQQSIRELAKNIVKENKIYIGRDVADEAIKNIDKMLKEQEEGGNENVEEKTKKRRGRKPKSTEQAI